MKNPLEPCNHYSIERRIGAGLLLILLFSMALLALLAEYGVGRLSDSFVTTRLQHDADSLIKALQLEPDGRLSVDPQHLPTVYQRVDSGHYYQVLSDQQRLRSRSLWERIPELAPLKPGQSISAKLDQGQEHWLVWHQGVRLHDQPLTLWLAEDIAPLERQWRRFTWLLYSAMLLLTLLLLLTQRWLLRRSFDRIDSVRHAIHLLQQGEIQALSGAIPSEIRPLTEEINRLLTRLEQRISRSRTAMGNLAHELKRALARLRLLQDALPHQDAEEYQRVLSEMERLTARELQRARIAGSPHPGRRFNPNHDLDDLLQVVQRIYPAVNFSLNLAAPGELPYDRDDMLELLGNLLDNAAKFGASEVQLGLLQSPEHLNTPPAPPFTQSTPIDNGINNHWCFYVSDNGPGVSDVDLERLTQRGIRLDETAAGHGLGLSICQMIADSYSGQLQIRANHPRGLRVEVWLPV